jgi:hypothetical protein
LAAAAAVLATTDLWAALAMVHLHLVPLLVVVVAVEEEQGEVVVAVAAVVATASEADIPSRASKRHWPCWSSRRGEASTKVTKNFRFILRCSHPLIILRTMKTTLIVKYQDKSNSLWRM